jgi:hypothetical protein
MPDYYEWHQTEREDLNEGWIWIRNADLREEVEERRPVLLLKHASRSVCCETLWADDAWLSRRHKPILAAKFTGTEKLIFLSAWYRRRLGIDNKPGSKIELKISTNPSWWLLRPLWWQLRAGAAHPQIAVAMSTVLAVIGTGLGIVGLATVFQKPHLPTDIWEAGAWAIALVGFVVILLGFAPLYSRAKN